MPSGKRDQPSIEDNHDGTVSLKYDPKEEGLHELFVKYNGENVQGKYHSLYTYPKPNDIREPDQSVNQKHI